MRAIDMHAHMMPAALWRGEEWHGIRYEAGEEPGTLVASGKRSRVPSPKIKFSPEERLRDMDGQKVDVQVVSIHTSLMGYDRDPEAGRRLARDVNDEIASMVRQWPARLA